MIRRKPPATGPRRQRSSALELVVILAVAFGLAYLVQAFVVKPFRIPSRSMVPTLTVGQRVLVDRVTKLVSDPRRGDITVFMPPAGADANQCGVRKQPNRACPAPTAGEGRQAYIKRIVAVPGDRLKVERGRVYINGELQEEPFIEPSADCSTCNLPEEITIPPDHFFMMGDNRGGSADSREWGPVPRDQIIGKARFTYWPVDRIGGL